MKKLIILQLLICIFIYSHAKDATLIKLPNNIAPVINGTIETLWDTIETHQIQRTYLSDLPTVNSYWKAVWNDSALFVLVSVTDDLHCDQWCAGAADYLSDRVELYLDVNANLKDGKGPSGAPNGHYQCSSSFIQNVNQYYFSGNHWENFYYNYAYRLNGTNYVTEFAIRWNTLKDANNVSFNPGQSDYFGFDVNIVDRDSVNGTVRQAVWRNKGNSEHSWDNMDSCGVVALVDNLQKINLLNSSGNALTSGTNLKVASFQTAPHEFVIKNRGSKILNISSINISGTGYAVSMSSKRALTSLDTLVIKLKYSQNANVNGVLQIISNDLSNNPFTLNLNAINATPVEGGIVSGTWEKVKSPYWVFGDVTIPDAQTLTIESGVKVIFQGHYNMKIIGRLLALGKLNDSILFTIKDTTGFSIFNLVDGSWRGIEHSGGGGSNNDTSKLNYCILEYAKKLSGAEFGSGDGGALLVAGVKKMKISNSCFRINHSSGTGGAIAGVNNFGTPAEIHISNSKFYKNTSNEGGAIQISGLSRCWISNSKFFMNQAFGGGGIEANNALLYMTNSIVTNNTVSFAGGGIYLIQSNSYFANNIISNNQAVNGGGVNINNCSPYFYNNNICYNKSFNNTGAGVLIWDISPATFINNIFWGNSSNYGATDTLNQFDIGSSGQPKFYNCLIQGGFESIKKGSNFLGDTAYIFKEYPSFVNAPTATGINGNGLLADWRVASNSIVINNGQELPATQLDVSKDFYGNKRIFHKIIDIGAVETHNTSSFAQGLITKDTAWIADTVKVSGNIKIASTAKLTIAPGTVIEFQGHYKFRVFGSLSSKGTPDAMIKFTVKDTTGLSNTNSKIGAWNGISINNGYWNGANYTMPVNDSIIIDNTIIEYVKNMANNWDTTVGGAVQIKYYSNVRVSNCIIRNNIAAIGAGINIDGFSKPKIINNKIYSNTALYEGAGINIVGNSNPIVMNNFISNNRGSAGGLNINISNPIVVNNIISNNYCSGSGGGVCITNSYPVFSNNTIVNNLTKYEGGGIFIYECTPLIYNTILWGNRALSGAQSVSSFGNSELHNCIIQETTDGSWTIEGRLGSVVKVENIVHSDPGFIKASQTFGNSTDFLTANWAISDFSGAIDKGANNFGYNLVKDIVGNSRVNNEVIDIGAYENRGSKIVFTTQPVGVNLCTGDSIAFSVSVNDTAHFQWQKDGKDIVGATGKKLVFNKVADINNGIYQCLATSAYGPVYSNAAIIQVKTAPSLLSQTSSAWINSKNPFTINATVNGSNPMKYQWSKNDVILSSDTSGSIGIDSFLVSNEGIYKCNISNICGNISIQPVKLYVSPTITSNNKANGCIGDTFKWNVSFNDVATYQWLKDGKDIAGAKSKDYSLKLTEGYSGNISCRVRNSINSLTTSPIFVQAGKSPEIKGTPKNGWYDELSSFTLEVTAAGSDPIAYQWYHGTSEITNEISNRIKFAGFTLKDEGTYYCYISNNCGTVETDNIVLNLTPELLNNNGYAVCENDTFILKILNNNTATYQWYKDGVTIDGAKDKNFQVVNPTSQDIGNYTCKVSGVIGNKILGPTFLNIKKAPSVDALQSATYIDATLSASIGLNLKGDEPFEFQWYKNDIAIVNQKLEVLRLNTITKANEANYKCRITNSCGFVETNEIKLVIAPQLCIVSNDFQTDSNSNMLVWDRNSSVTYDHYNVYRESYIRDKYDSIGYVPYNALTLFIDTTVNPKTQAFMYKITAVDASGKETDINATAPHKTIHLLVTQGIPKGIQLDWDEYIGFDYSTYNIFRSIDNAQFDSIYSMSSTSRTFTDFDAPVTKNLKYFVSVSRKEDCYANSLKKAGAGPFASAVSNMEDNSRLKFTQTGINENKTNGLSIFPNPFGSSSQFNYKLEKESDVRIFLTDLSGRQMEKLVETKQLSGNYTLRFGEKLNPGIYLLNVSINYENSLMQVLKIK